MRIHFARTTPRARCACSSRPSIPPQRLRRRLLRLAPALSSLLGASHPHSSDRGSAGSRCATRPGCASSPPPSWRGRCILTRQANADWPAPAEGRAPPPHRCASRPPTPSRRERAHWLPRACDVRRLRLPAVVAARDASVEECPRLGESLPRGLRRGIGACAMAREAYTPANRVKLPSTSAARWTHVNSLGGRSGGGDPRSDSFRAMTARAFLR